MAAILVGRDGSSPTDVIFRRDHCPGRRRSHKRGAENKIVVVCCQKDTTNAKRSLFYAVCRVREGVGIISDRTLRDG